MKRSFVLTLAATVLGVATTASADWNYVGEIVLPTATPDLTNPAVLAADDAGDIIYIGSLNFTGAAQAEPVVRFDINTSDPLDGTFTQIHSRTVPNGRGVTGLAYDAATDVLYVSGSSENNAADQWIDKIATPSATPAVTQDWKAGGGRWVGCDLAVDGADTYLAVGLLTGPTVEFFNTATGASTGTGTLSGNFARDLVVIPDTYEVFLNRNGNLQVLTGGSPSTPAGYAQGVDVVAGANPTTMDFTSGCYIGYTDLTPTPMLFWGAAEGGAGGDTLIVTYLDDTNYAKDETIQVGAANDTPFTLATDSVVIDMGGTLYLYVLEYGTTKLHVYSFAVGPTDAESWEVYQ